jgi:hypothetical protein
VRISENSRLGRSESIVRTWVKSRFTVDLRTWAKSYPLVRGLGRNPHAQDYHNGRRVELPQTRTLYSSSRRSSGI